MHWEWFCTVKKHLLTLTCGSTFLATVVGTLRLAKRWRRNLPHISGRKVLRALLLTVQPASPWSLLEMQNLGPPPGLLILNLHFYQDRSEIFRGPCRVSTPYCFLMSESLPALPTVVCLTSLLLAEPADPSATPACPPGASYILQGQPMEMQAAPPLPLLCPSISL